MRQIYLDYAATTPADPRVIECMRTALDAEGDFANPSSAHRPGRNALARVDEARRKVADRIGADPREIIFTSGATEANNLALKGLAARHPAGHIVTSAIEHSSVLDVCAALEQNGHAVTRVAPDAHGAITTQAVMDALRADTFLVSVMHANNETGVINDLAAIAHVCRERGIAFHSDAAQSLGSQPLDMQAVPLDLLSLSAHKVYGPKGLGALFVRRRAGLELAPLLHGGGQERGLRPGTLATHQIAGFGMACALLGDADEVRRIAALRDRLQQGIVAVGDVQVHGSGERLPGHLNVGFGGVRGETLLRALDGLAVSQGSACHAASMRPSHVLEAMGVSGELAQASLRFSLGRFTTEAEIEAAIALLARVLPALRSRG
ncbi:MAG: cysteine desulfurase [Xanthomonadales bacterium]|nr:cysteine desulfurase [Xanthomonadales bacterium]